MTVTYGVARENDRSDSAAQDGDNDTSPLLGTDASPSPAKDNEGVAGIPSSVGNLANTIIGSGMLTFPLALASSGILPGVLTCIFSGGCAALGLYLLSLCAPHAPKRHASFFTLAQLTFPRAAVIFDAAIAIKCFGVSISYLIIIKSLMPGVVAALYHTLSSHDPPEWTSSTHIWLTLFMFILVPLSCLRKLDQLRHTSYIALFSAAYLVLIVIVCFIWPPSGMPKRGEVNIIKFKSNFLSNFPVQVFAFTCSQNLFPIYNELRANTQQRMNIIIGSAIGGATLTYEVIAVFGYLTFGDKVGPNIIQMYPATSLFIACGQAAIIILVLFSYALQVMPCRNCLDKVFSLHAVKTLGEDEAVDDEGPREMTVFKHAILTTLIVGGGYTIAYLVSDLQVVLSFVGATGSTTISFILPGLFFWKLFKDKETSPRISFLRKAAAVLVVYGVCVLVFCLSYNIYALVSHSKSGKH